MLTTGGEQTQARHRNGQKNVLTNFYRERRIFRRGLLASVSVMKDVVADVVTRLVQRIRQSRLSSQEKQVWINEIAGMKFEPTKLVPFKK